MPLSFPLNPWRAILQRRQPAGRRSSAACRRALTLFLTALASAIAAAAERPRALTPDEALKSFQLEPGLRIELVAAEPLVVDPVAFAFDEHQRLYVVEGRGYPEPIGGQDAPVGRIALLEDVDGDGRYERRREFATGLKFVNGIAPWRGGVFVTMAPDILYLKDNDGDGVADERRVVLTGFDSGKSSQLRVSHPTLGLDGKIYVTSGLSPGKVTSPVHPDRPAVSFTPRDGRFDPDTLVFENTGGRGQFGLAFDPFGRRFVTTNRHPILQVMLEPWHLRRNPHLAFAETTQEVSKVEAQARINRISRAAVTADFMPRLMAAPHAGTFTSACGLLIFGGTALTPAHVGNAFICEPAQNLVQRQVLRPAGASFRSDPPDPKKEFLASTDVWFRPVYLGHGPDGALYLADMYRREIDHPVYVPEESRGGLDFESGKEHGRIYRIVSEGVPRNRRPAPPAAGAAREPATAELVRELESADEWWRARAHRLLLERADRAGVPAVERLAAEARLAETRARALWLLHGLGGLSAETLVGAARDADARVREQAVLLAGERAGGSAPLREAVQAAARDAEPRVRFAAALVLGSVDDPQAVPALAAIAVRDGEDRWTRAAVLSGIASRMTAFLAGVHAARAENPRAFALVMEHLGRVIGAGGSPEAAQEFLAQSLASDADVPAQIASVLGLIDGARGRAGAAKGTAPKGISLGDDSPNAPALQRLFAAATRRATDSAIPVSERLSAIALLGYTDFAFAGATLGRLLDAREPPEVQLQAVRALERIGDPRGGALLTAKASWARYTPQVREAVIATLSSKPPLIEVLFEAVKAGTVAPHEISSTRRAQLMKHNDAKVREAAEDLFKQLEGGDRMQVYRAYRETLNVGIDLAKGREAFVRACSACHTHHGVGGNVGPDLTGIRNQPADAILMHILVPNYEVAPSYQTLTVTTQDGRTIAGWLVAETESNLTLRTAFGTEENVLRKNVASLTASGLSLMPDGLEQTMTKDEVASLVAFLKSDS